MPTGKKMPLDVKPCKMVIVKEGIGEIVDAYMPHWATCPGKGRDSHDGSGI